MKRCEKSYRFCPHSSWTIKLKDLWDLTALISCFLYFINRKLETIKYEEREKVLFSSKESQKKMCVTGCVLHGWFKKNVKVETIQPNFLSTIKWSASAETTCTIISVQIKMQKL